MELWKKIEGYSNYEVSNCGSVRSLARWVIGGRGGKRLTKLKVLKLGNHHSGYKHVSLPSDLDGLFKNLSVHTLVAKAFIGEKPEGSEVCHSDGVKSNNHVENLRWGSRVENANDKVLHGVAPIGQNNPKAKLNNDEVEEIVLLLKGGVAQNKIADDFGVSEITISHIACGRTWAHLTNIEFKQGRVTVTDDLIENIKTLKRVGKTLDEIATSLGISKPTAFRHSKGWNLCQ